MPENTALEVNKIVEQIQTISTKLANETATKSEVAKLEEALKAFEIRFTQHNAALEANKKYSQKHPLFGHMKAAQDMCDIISEVATRSLPRHIGKDVPLYSEKANTLNVTTNAQGAYTVPTELSGILLDLITRGAMARRVFTVYEGLTGPLDMPKGTSEASAAFVTNDTTTITDTDKSFGKSTLNPQQIGALFRSSLKLVRNSVLSIATLVANELTRAAGRLEDQAVLVGDGTGTYGNITGVRNDTNIANNISVASLAAATLDNLIDMQIKVHEQIDPENSAYYMSREAAAAFKKLKDGQGRYLIGLSEATPNINGVPVVIWKRMVNPTASGDTICFYGDAKMAGRIGIGRDVSIAVSEHVDFAKGGLVWRLLYDFDFGLQLPTAIVKLKVT